MLGRGAAVRAERRAVTAARRGLSRSPFRTSPEDSVARAKPALGAEHLSGKRLVKGVIRIFSDRLLARTVLAAARVIGAGGAGGGGALRRSGTPSSCAEPAGQRVSRVSDAAGAHPRPRRRVPPSRALRRFVNRERYGFSSGLRRTVGTAILMKACFSAAWHAVHPARSASIRCLKSARSFFLIASPTWGSVVLRRKFSALARYCGLRSRPSSTALPSSSCMWAA